MVSAIRAVHVGMILSWVGFAVLMYVGYFDGVYAVAMAAGTFSIAMGATTLLDPRIQGARDVNLITSEEVGPGERFGAQVGGIVMILMGLFICWLFWPR